MPFTPTAATLAAELNEADRLLWHTSRRRLSHDDCRRLLNTRLHGHAMLFMQREELVAAAIRSFFLAFVPRTAL